MDIILMPIDKPRLPPICEMNSKVDIRLDVTYFKTFFSLKKMLTIPISVIKASQVWSPSDSDGNIKFDLFLSSFVFNLRFENLLGTSSFRNCDESVLRYHGIVSLAFLNSPWADVSYGISRVCGFVILREEERIQPSPGARPVKNS